MDGHGTLLVELLVKKKKVNSYVRNSLIKKLQAQACVHKNFEVDVKLKWEYRIKENTYRTSGPFHLAPQERPVTCKPKK